MKQETKIKNPHLKDFYLQNARLLANMTPMLSHKEMIDNIQMEISNSMILNGGSKGVIISELLSDEYVRITSLSFDMHGFVPKHHHPHWCVVKMVSGVIVDAVNDDVYEVGEIVLYEPGKFHNAIATQPSTMLVFNTFSESIAKQILSRGEYLYRGKKASYQLLPDSNSLKSLILIEND